MGIIWFKRVKQIPQQTCGIGPGCRDNLSAVYLSFRHIQANLLPVMFREPLNCVGG